MQAEKDVIDKELRLQQQKLALPDLSSVGIFVKDVKLSFSCNRSSTVQNRILTEARSITVDAHHAVSTESAA